MCVCVKSVVVNGDHSALNLSLVANDNNRPSPSNHVDEPPEVTRRRKAELMTSLRLTDASGCRARSPTPEVETSTDWNGNQLLHEPPPPSKRRRTDVEEQPGRPDSEPNEKPEAEFEPEAEEAAKKGRTSLLSVLAVCSFTDIYNSYQRRQGRRRGAPEVLAATAENEPDSETGSGLTADANADRKTATWNGAVVRAEDVALPSDSGVYPLAARCVIALYLFPYRDLVSCKHCVHTPGAIGNERVGGYTTGTVLVHWAGHFQYTALFHHKVVAKTE